MRSRLVVANLLVLSLVLLLALLTKGAIADDDRFVHHKESAKTTSAAELDRVESLPLFGRPPSPQWSGYLNATAGCDTDVNGNDCQLHYWLALAEQDGDDDDGDVSADSYYSTRATQQKKSIKKKPLLLWLNGGPGASSIVGMLQELGPLLVNATGGLMRNPYAWTKVAHVLILESPVGVGYSYCANQKQKRQEEEDDGQSPSSSCRHTDRYTASAARAALEDFFFVKFAHLFAPTTSTTTDFYIAGESYAGVYIPTLAQEILRSNHHRQQQQQQQTTTTTGRSNTMTIPLKGILVGDPCTDNDAQRQSRDPLWYAHQNGLVDDAVYDTLTQQCNVSVMVEGDNDDDDRRLILQRNKAGRMMKDDPALLAMCTLALRKFQLSSSKGTNGKWAGRYIDHYHLYGLVDDSRAQLLTEQYMNRPDVRSALHIPDWLPAWTQHAPLPFDYQKEYAACNNVNSNHNNVDQVVDAPTTPSMIDVYRAIVPQLQRTWIFNGDADPCIPYEGTRTAVQKIGYPEIDGGGYRPWFYNETAASATLLREKLSTFGPNLQDTKQLGLQWGGHVIHYQHNLTFLTVHGSGHMVPTIRPIAALHMATMFLQQQQQQPSSSMMIAPLLVPDATLQSMNNSDFDEYLNKWINEAKDYGGQRRDEIVTVN
jgi:serine carboxypeptidase-like clade I